MSLLYTGYVLSDQDDPLPWVLSVVSCETVADPGISLSTPPLSATLSGRQSDTPAKGLIYVYCVLVIRAWTYEYGQNHYLLQCWGGGSLGIAHQFPPQGGTSHPSYVLYMGFKFLRG